MYEGGRGSYVSETMKVGGLAVSFQETEVLPPKSGHGKRALIIASFCTIANPGKKERNKGIVYIQTK